MTSFSDRFTHRNSTLEVLVEDPNVDDEELEAASPELAEMASMVRRFSVILTSVSTREIYYAITQHADPNIALILGSAKDKDGQFIFASEAILKQFMYGDPTYPNTVRNIFTDGIRRVSACLAAAELIEKFATIPTQREHAEALKNRAEKDLDRIITFPTGEAPKATATSGDDVTGFFFERGTFNLTREIRVRFYMPDVDISLTTWKVAGTYGPGTVNTANIVCDLADYINSVTLQSKSSNVMAAPILAGPNELHQIRFTTRARMLNVNAEVLTVNIQDTNKISPTNFQESSGTAGDLPFKWGTSLDNLATYETNSVIILSNNAKATATGVGGSSRLDKEEFEPTILYFRRNGEITPEDGVLVYRVAPTQDKEVTITIPRLTGTNQGYLDASRPSQVATALINSLFSLTGTTRALGALFRNDSPTSSNPIAGVELIAWSITDPNAFLVLDIIEFPKDIEIATGRMPVFTRSNLGYEANYLTTPFSNRPRSVRVSTKFIRGLDGSGGTSPTFGKTQVTKWKKPRILDLWHDEVKAHIGYDPL